MKIFTKRIVVLFTFSLLVTCLNAQEVSKKKAISPTQKKITTPLIGSRESKAVITTSSKPIASPSKNNTNSVANQSFVRGEGEYLSFTKKIMEVSVTGQIPDGFPKHVKGQSKEQYIAIMKAWAKENKDWIKPEYHNQLN